MDTDAGSGSDGIEHDGGVRGTAHSLGGEDGEVSERDMIAVGDAAEMGDSLGHFCDRLGWERQGLLAMAVPGVAARTGAKGIEE